MTKLKELTQYPIDVVFFKHYYEKLLFTHPKKIKLIGLFITHILLLTVLYILPIFYDNIYFNVFYVLLIIAMVCGWIVFNGECWINSWEKKILNPNYKNGDNLDVNPSIDLVSNYTVYPFLKLFKKDKKTLINKDEYIRNKKNRYNAPLLIPLLSIILFSYVRLKNVPIEYRVCLIIFFIILLIITHLKWKSLDEDYS